MNIKNQLKFDNLCKSVADQLKLALISFDKDMRIVDSTSLAAGLVRLESSIDQTIACGTDLSIWKNWNKLIGSALLTRQKSEFGTVKYNYQGQQKLLNITCIPILDPASEEIIGGAVAMNDITEKLDIEQELAHAERLIAIGKVAGKVAHELNNPLDGILRYVNLSLRTIENGHPDKAANYLQHCREGLQRMAKIITELLEFSRSTHLAFETSAIDKLVEDALRAMEHPLRNIDVQIIREYTDPVPHQKSDSLFQVFCNLIKNASDAMQGQGRLSITIHQAKTEWQVSFHDSGPGLDPKTIDDLFKPFYTTKPKGQGTGLGLAICRDMLAKLDCTITAQNAPEGGGLFTVHLPLHTSNSTRS